MIIIQNNFNWFLSTVAQSNAALLGIVSAFIINRILNEYEKNYDLEASVSGLYYQAMSLLPDQPKANMMPVAREFNLEKATYVDLSSISTHDRIYDSIVTYNKFIDIYHQIITKRNRIALTKKLLIYLLVSIVILVIYPIHLIIADNETTISLSIPGINTLEFIRSSFGYLLSFQGIIVVVTFLCLFVGIAYLWFIVRKLQKSNKEVLNKLSNIFTQYIGNQVIKSDIRKHMDKYSPLNE